MRILKRGTASACALAVAALAFAGCGGGDDDGPAYEGETIKLGSIFSTSGAGSAFGPQQVRGARLAMQQINADEGIEGATLKISQRDDASDPERTPVAMRGLIEEEQVLAVLGPTFSNSAATADPIANELGTPVLAVSNTGPGIVGKCDYPCDLIFRNSLGEAEAIPANVGSLFAEDRSIAKAVVAYPRDDPFGKTSAETATQALTDEGARIAAAIEFVSPQRLRRLPAEPDVVVITASSGETAADAIVALRAGGYAGPILGGNAFNSVAANEAAGPVGEGARSAAAWFSGNDSEANNEFIAAYRLAYDEEPDQFAAQAYTGVMLLAEAAEEADLSFDDLAADRLALAEALAEVRMETPLGNFRFTADHDVSQPIWIVEMDGRGGFGLVTRIDPDAAQ